MKRISFLIARHVIGKTTDAEKRELAELISFDPAIADLLHTSSDLDDLTDCYRLSKRISYERPMKDMQGRIRQHHKSAMRKYAFMSVAAGVACIILGCIAYLTLTTDINNYSGQPSIVAKNENISDIRHGDTKAVLTTASGQTFSLTDTIVVKTIMKTWSIASAETYRSPDIVNELCLDVPKGGEFKITLEDSTTVWLNSQSTLRYPENFIANERRVSVTGEAYFEVRKDENRPFIVESQGQEIRVYGTTFNLRAYDDEANSYTTLQSGSIALATGRDTTSEIFLIPGKQAILNHDNSDVGIIDVDSDIVSSWIHGFFVFENQTFGNIMRDLSRWYNFEFEIIDKELEDEIYMGAFPRNTDFDKALQILECSDEMIFRIEDGKVLISKK